MVKGAADVMEGGEDGIEKVARGGECGREEKKEDIVKWIEEEEKGERKSRRGGTDGSREVGWKGGEEQKPERDGGKKGAKHNFY